MKIIIAGGREFNNYAKLKREMDFAVSKLNQSNIEVVSGVCRGADLLGERWAKERGFPIKQFPADWNKYGKGAGYRRNSQMANYADALIAFWDGESDGTRNMINLAKKKELQIRIVRYEISN